MRFLWFLSGRRYFSFSKLWTQSHFRSDRYSGLVARPALNFENSLSVWMKYNRLWFLVQKRLWSSHYFIQSFITTCSNCPFRSKVMVHLQVVRGRVCLLVESNFESVSKVGVGCLRALKSANICPSENPRIQVLSEYKNYCDCVCKAGLKGWWHNDMHAVCQILGLFKLLWTSI